MFSLFIRARQPDNAVLDGCPDTKVGTSTQMLCDEAKKQGWVVISMKNDWKRIFTFE
jgi:hypothetical protein